MFAYQNIAMRILWTAPNPEATFGTSIMGYVRRGDPNTIIHNNRTQGRLDISLKAYQLYKESGAEAVLVVSNKKFTTQIVYDMESRDIPAYGVIFDP